MSDNYFGAYSEFDDDFVDDFEIEDSPEFLAFMEKLSEDLDAWRNKTKIRIINPVKYAQFKDAIVGLTRLIKKDNPTAKIEYNLSLNDEYTQDTGNCSITAISYSLDIDDIKSFVDAIKHSFGIELMGSNQEGKIRMSISFRGIYEDLYIEE